MSVAATRGDGLPAADPDAAESGRTAAPAIPPVPFEHEDLVVHRGDRSGCDVIVAIHSTALGPSLGGVRMWHYADTGDGIRDALRLARGMTMKASAAGLDLGGGKGVICSPQPGPPRGELRRALLLDFADLVEALGGRYITAEDVGITPDDLVVIRERTSHVTGLPQQQGGSGDPSPFTATGVEAAMRACARHSFGSADLEGRRVAIVGLGHVGEQLARRLAAHGAELSVTDIDPDRRARADELGARWLEPGSAILADCDMLSPCALGGAIHSANVGLLRAKIVCGSANNQLADEGLDADLANRGILYAPDFIANAGGLMHVYMEIRGYGEEKANELVTGIEATLGRILDAAAERSITPLAAALELAQERLDAVAAEPLVGGDRLTG